MNLRYIRRDMRGPGNYCGQCLRGQSFEKADELFLVIDAVLRGKNKWSRMRVFSIGCRDPGNILKPMVTILKELKEVSWVESVSRGRCRDAHGSVRHPIYHIIFSQKSLSFRLHDD
jgi:hypothetical protein